MDTPKNLAKRLGKKWAELTGKWLKLAWKKSLEYWSEWGKLALNQSWKYKKIIAALLAWWIIFNSHDIYSYLNQDKHSDSDNVANRKIPSNENPSSYSLDETTVYAPLKSIPTKENYKEFFATSDISQEQVEKVFMLLENGYNELWKEVLWDEEILFDVLVLMIKESHLQDKNWKTTVGYGQIKSIAQKDTNQYLNKITEKSYNLDRNKPADNVKISLAYFRRVENLVNHYLDDGINYPKEFVYMAYNGWAKRVANIMNTYADETGNNSLVWDDFAEWLVSKIEENPTKKSTYSKSYSVNYADWFVNNYSNNRTNISFKNTTTNYAKIYEMINYVEKINAIKTTDQRQAKQENTPQQPKKPKVNTLPYSEKRDKFHGDGWWDELRYDWSSHDEYNQIKSISWKGIIDILKAANIDPTQENIDKFRDINRLDEGDVIKKNAYYLVQKVTDDNRWKVQNIVTSSNSLNSQWNKRDIKNEQHEITEYSELLKRRPDFYGWLNSIEAKNTTLKWYTIVLDPGHGGGDVWAIPIARFANGKPIPYFGSDIDSHKRLVANGHGDQKLRTIESIAVMDIVSRLAKLIKENGGDVHTTHYFQDKPHNVDFTESHNSNAPWLLDLMEKWSTKWDGSEQRYWVGSDTSVTERSRIRRRIRDTIMKKIWDTDKAMMLSIHADILAKNDRWMSVRYSENNQKSFADKLAKWNKKANVQRQGLYMNRYYPDGKWKHGSFKNSALVEVANMRNVWDSWKLRFADKRQEIAEQLFEMIVWAK